VRFNKLIHFCRGSADELFPSFAAEGFTRNMGPQRASDFNNLGLMLLESHCLIPARKALEDAETMVKTKQLPKSRVYSTEAPPRRNGAALSWAIMEFSEITTATSSRTFMERVRVLSFPRTLVVIRLMPKCPFTPAVILYNLAMVYFAESRTGSNLQINVDKAEQAKSTLEEADILLKQWTVALVPKMKEKPEILRACLMLRLLVLSKRRVFFDAPVQNEILGIHHYLANHDLSNSLQSLESSGTHALERLEI
jgi:hypothetical protein